MSVLRRVSILLPLVTVLLCGLLTSDLAADLVPLPTGDDLEYSIETDKTVYQLGETVYVTHTITNPLDVPVSIELSQEPGFNLWVMQGNTEIWAAYRVFAQVIGSQGFAPGEILELNYTWDMTDYDDNLVLWGEYELVGVIYGGGRDVSTNITIVPEPTTIMLLVFGGLSILRSNRRN